MNETTSLKDGDSISRPCSPAASDIDFEAGGGVDFEIEEDPAAEARDDGGLSVDMSSKDDSSLGGRAGRRSGLGDLEISGLDENGEESSKSTASSKSAKKKKRKDAANKKGPKRMKKRRKIVIDNNATELSSDHMKAMLRDTSDIVLQNVPDLAAWPREDDGGDDDDAYVGICPALQRLPTERLLARPCIGDDGGLAPELLALWMRNTVRVEGKTGTQLPFRMRGARGREQRGAAAERVMEEEARRQLEEEDEDGEVERARSQQQGEEEEGGEPREDDELDFGGGGDDFNLDEDRAAEDDLETPFDVKDEFGAVEYKNDDLADDDDLSQRSDGSNFSLGAVNDLEKELYDVDEGEDGEEESEERQALGEEAAHTHKWHKHTVRVFGILKRQMRSEDDDGEGADEEGDEKPTELSYNKLSSGCSRRTAAGVFFEMLQLKTWDYVEVRESLFFFLGLSIWSAFAKPPPPFVFQLDQQKDYGDITVRPGARFAEDPPN